MSNGNSALQPGTTIVGPKRSYKVIKTLGHGGFGITYLVEGDVMVDNIKVTARFALKEHFIGSLCSRDGSTQQVSFSEPVAKDVRNSLDSFVKEATRLQSNGLKHPNIVNINEVFEANNTAYYVMEYLEGETLEDFIKSNGALTEQQTVYFMRPIAEAVALLHRNNLTHYDIKPSNIIIHRGADGVPRPVLIDFGLSKHYDSHGNATSMMAGGGFSAGYSPIEQYTGLTTFTPQADVYALAATVYHCLTGHAPAEAATGPVQTLTEDLAGVASPHMIEALKHAMASFATNRTPDASRFIAEVFDGQEIEVPNTRATQRRVSAPVMPSVTADDGFDASKTTPFAPGGGAPGGPNDGAGAFGSETYNDGVDDGTVIMNGNDPGKNKKNGKMWLWIVLILAAAGIGAGLYFWLGDSKPKTVISANDSDDADDDALPTVDEEEVYVTGDTTVTVVEAVDSAAYIEPAPAAVAPAANEQPAYSEPTRGTKATGRSSYKNFDIATNLNGRRLYFSKDEWNTLTGVDQNEYNVLGVVLTECANGPFIISLYEHGTMSWYDAESNYGEYNLLLKSYRDAVYKNSSRLNSVLRAAGGDPISVGSVYWGCGNTNDLAWAMPMGSGDGTPEDKTAMHRVRSIKKL